MLFQKGIQEKELRYAIPHKDGVRSHQWKRVLMIRSNLYTGAWHPSEAADAEPGPEQTH